MRRLTIAAFALLAVGQAMKRRRLQRNAECLDIPVCSQCAALPDCFKAKAERFRRQRNA